MRFCALIVLLHRFLTHSVFFLCVDLFLQVGTGCFWMPELLLDQLKDLVKLELIQQFYYHGYIEAISDSQWKDWLLQSWKLEIDALCGWRPNTGHPASFHQCFFWEIFIDLHFQLASVTVWPWYHCLINIYLQYFQSQHEELILVDHARQEGRILITRHFNQLFSKLF